MPTLVCAAENDVFRQFGEAAADLIPGAAWAALPPSTDEAAKILGDFAGS